MKTVSYELARELLEALKPFIGSTLTDNGDIVGLMREDFERARDAAAKAEAAMAGPQPDADGWIKWGGGECPVSSDTRVELKFRSGQVWIDDEVETGCFWRWSHDGCPADIIAYRIVKEPQ